MSDRITPSLSERVIAREDITKPTVRSGVVSGISKAGAIADQIGTGEHAKDSFIWRTLTYCFYIATAFSSAIIIAYLYFVFFKDDPNKINIVSSLKDVWSIFTPILTLALGYAFGKKDKV